MALLSKLFIQVQTTDRRLARLQTNKVSYKRFRIEPSLSLHPIPSPYLKRAANLLTLIGLTTKPSCSLSHSMHVILCPYISINNLYLFIYLFIYIFILKIKIGLTNNSPKFVK